MPQAAGTPTVKPFSWSWSKLKNYRTCPKRHYEIDIAKHYRDADSDALKWGNQVHDAMAKYIGQGIELPTIMKRYKAWPENVVKLSQVGMDVRVEQSLAIAKDFGPCSYYAGEAWFRAKIDVLAMTPKKEAAITIDWKTGSKVQPEFEQLALSAQTVFAHFPTVEEVVAYYVWFGHDTHTVETYHRDDMVKIWNALWPEINVMDDAWRTTTYPAKPSGLCINYCPVTNCPFYGKGSR